MHTRAFERMADSLVKNKIISAEDKELYEYGLKQIAGTFVTILTTLIIGFIFAMVWESVLFTVSYIPLRSYAGGYHARTPLNCYIFSIILTIFVLLAIKYVQYNFILIGALILFASIILFIFAPFADENKPLDEVETKVFKKRTRIVLVAEITLIGLFGMLGLTWIAVCTSVSVFVSSLMVVAGVVRKTFLNLRNAKNLRG